jgi:HlyD family secretion protein
MIKTMLDTMRGKLNTLLGTLYALTGTIKARLPWLRDKIDAAYIWVFGEKGPRGSAGESIRRHVAAGGILVALLVFGLGGWASTAEISGALIAQGSVVVDSNVKKVQHPTGGVVGQLFVHDGDHVKAGDMLIRLDETVTQANLAIVTKGLTELYARKARLAAERDGVDTVAPSPELADHLDDPDVKEALNSERKLFDLRRQDRVGQKQQLQERITQLQQEISGLAAQQDAKKQQIGLIDQELQGVRDLYAKNLVQLNRLTSLERDEAQMQGELGQLVAQAAEAKGKIAEIQLQIIQVDEDLSSDVAKELRETDSKIGEYVERKVTAEDQLKRTDIRAPQDGTVFQSTANTVGGVISAGDTIMQIVPESDNLMVEVKVEPRDIDQVQFGQPVVLRFSAFNVRTTPELNGSVARIGADTTTDQRTGASYYLVRIAMTADEVKRLGDVKLTPGMPVEAFIQTGERTMLSYLVKPLHDQLMRSFREN